MIFKNKSPEELKREEFERQCRLATQEVIARGNQKDKENGFGAAWPYEIIQIIKDGSITTRIRSSVFYWGSLLSLIAGIVLVSNEIYAGGIFILTVSPCLLLYPLLRLLFGGKDSVGAAITTVIVEELVKREIINSFEKKSKRRR